MVRRVDDVLGPTATLLVSRVEITKAGNETIVFTTEEMIVNYVSGKKLVKKHGEDEFVSVTEGKIHTALESEVAKEAAKESPVDVRVAELANSPGQFYGKHVRLRSITLGALVIASPTDEATREIIGGGEFRVSFKDKSGEQFAINGSPYLSLPPDMAASYSETGRLKSAIAALVEKFNSNDSDSKRILARAVAATQFVAGGGSLEKLPEVLLPGVKSILNLFRGTGRLFSGGHTSEDVMERLYGTPRGAPPLMSPVEITMASVDVEVIELGTATALRVYSMRSSDGEHIWTESELIRKSGNSTLTKSYGAKNWAASSSNGLADKKPKEQQIDLVSLLLSVNELLLHENKDYIVEGCRRIAESGEIDDAMVPLLLQHLSTVGYSVAKPAMLALVVGAGERVVDDLAALLKSDQPHVRDHAAMAIGRLALFGVDVEKCEPQLLHIRVKDSSKAAQNSARDALAAIQSDRKRTVARLKLVANDPGWSRHVAQRLLKAHGEDGLDATVSLLKAPSPGVRDGASAALVAHGKTAIPKLNELLNATQSKRVKETVQAVIDQISQPQDGPPAEAKKPVDIADGKKHPVRTNCGELLSNGKQMVGMQVSLQDAKMRVRIDPGNRGASRSFTLSDDESGDTSFVVAELSPLMKAAFDGAIMLPRRNSLASKRSLTLTVIGAMAEVTDFSDGGTVTLKITEMETSLDKVQIQWKSDRAIIDIPSETRTWMYGKLGWRIDAK